MQKHKYYILGWNFGNVMFSTDSYDIAKTWLDMGFQVYDANATASQGGPWLIG